MLHRIWQFVNGLGACLLLLWIIHPQLGPPFVSQLPDDMAAMSDDDRGPGELVPDGPSNGDASVGAPASRIIGSGDLPLEYYCRPPRDAAGLTAVQHTMTGRIALGRRFFQRLRGTGDRDHLFNEVRQWAWARGLEAGPRLEWVPETFEMTDPEWTRMARWWNATSHVNTYADAWPAAEQEFEALAAKSNRTRDEDQKLWRIVITCGRDWLRVPYDSQTGRFDLDADLPSDSPETVVRYYRRMYKAVLGHDYPAAPKYRF